MYRDAYRRCDEETVACRTCIYAIRGGIGKTVCEVYSDPAENRKPDDVYFGNAPCPYYAPGEDLLPFEIRLV